MTNYEITEILAKAFTNGEIDNLFPLLADDCEYTSDYSDVNISTSEKIAERMKSVSDGLDEDNGYMYEIKKFDDILCGITHNELAKDDVTEINEYGIILYRFKEKYPVAVVYTELYGNKIKHITLSQNMSWFDIDFYSEIIMADWDDDLPSTVEPYKQHGRSLNRKHGEIQNMHLYIWKQADLYLKSFLENKGIYLLESEVFEDCIGYHFYRDGHQYTLYMYAYGQKQTSQLDGDYCEKLSSYEFSKDSRILVIYLKVKKFFLGADAHYKVLNYCGDDKNEPELWELYKINGKPVLRYFPGEYLMTLSDRFVYAFNNNNLEAYYCIIKDINPFFKAYDRTLVYQNYFMYAHLLKLHKKYGDMKYGYVRYNDVIYSKVPYLENYGFFSFSANSYENRIDKIESHPFDGGERKVMEFIKNDEIPDDNYFTEFPALIGAETLPPVDTERFALKLKYDNGETKKYILPIPCDSENDEVLSYRGYVFTDRIWQSAFIVKDKKADIEGYADFGPSIEFKNGFSLSAFVCYHEGEDYSEPELCGDTVFEDDFLKIERLWRWNVESLYEEKETGLIKTLVSGFAFNYDGVSAYVTPDGKRLNSINFDYIGEFYDGLALVMKYGCGYGYINEKTELAIPLKYENAFPFCNGFATVKKDGKWFLIDKNGNEISLQNPYYEKIKHFSEGMCPVASKHIDVMNLAYNSDEAFEENGAGIWGYINEKGEEVIPPQYIFAYGFKDGRAFVCKGEWTIDKKWDNEYNEGNYWSEEQLWGAIDKNGNEIIPFIFDEIIGFDKTDDYYIAHYGGWEKGKYGIIDKKGNWVLEPSFEHIEWEYRSGLFAFSYMDFEGDDCLLGIYDLNQKKIIFEPQFLDVDFEDDGFMNVVVYDKELKREVGKIIDINGNEKFRSVYSVIFSHGDYYEVTVYSEGEKSEGILDKNGNVILPCKNDILYGGISYKNRLYGFMKGDKCGIKDFDGNIIVPPVYSRIEGLYADNYLLIAHKGGKSGVINLEGKIVLPFVYNEIKMFKNNIFACKNADGCELLQYTLK